MAGPLSRRLISESTAAASTLGPATPARHYRDIVTHHDVADEPREVLLTREGISGVSYLRDTRDGAPLADLLESNLDEAQIIDLVLDRLPGWQLAADPALGRALLERGAMTVRHAHTLAIDTNLAGTDWHEPTLPDGLNFVGVDPSTLDIMSLMPSQREAYPPGHPDHDPDIGLNIGLMVLIVGGEILGPLVPESALVMNGDEVVAGLLINQRHGRSPHGGPWVADVWRHPDHRGLGTLLLKRAIARLRDRGEPHLTLTVTEGNPARARYEALGFTLADEALRIRLPEATLSAGLDTARAFLLESMQVRAHQLVSLGDSMIGVRDDRYPFSYDNNAVLVLDDMPANEVVAAAEHHLADAGHRQVTILASVSAEWAQHLVDAGYSHQPMVVMTRRVTDLDAIETGAESPVAATDEPGVAEWVTTLWGIDLPGASTDQIRQLVDRRALLDIGSTVVRLAARDDSGHVVASCDLIARGGIAEVDAVSAHPDHRQRGLGRSLMRAACGEAHRLGVRVLVLTALRDDWPREWYARLGFDTVGEQHSFTRATPTH
ncbi:unannotated protein [freshwater metagenome]|uniref:Unannotated protein n=1 Tax=freshwater metagenome TaxID=449393 RepID=A0A6J7KI54_9ZZZZ